MGTIYLKNRTVEAPFILQIFVQSAVPAAAFLLTALFTGTLRPSTLNLGGVLPAVYMAWPFHHWAWLLHVPAQTVAHIGRFHLRIYQSDCRADDEPSCTA